VPHSQDEKPAVRILVVDDNPDALEGMMYLLQALGYETRGAETGPEGLAIAAEWRPEIGLLDIGLPGMDGYELARRLRALPGMEEIGLVAWTGFGEERDRRLAREAGFDRHLVKPVDLKDLREALADVAPRVPA
jgi:CheY-like chemotaxis protein